MKRTSDEASCAKSAPFRMKKKALDSVARLRMKDPKNENGFLTNAGELENEAVFGCLEEPLIVSW